MSANEPFFAAVLRGFRRNFLRSFCVVMAIAVAGATLRLEFGVNEELVYYLAVAAAVLGALWVKVQETREEAAEAKKSNPSLRDKNGR